MTTNITIPLALLEQLVGALELAGVIVDGVPTRWHELDTTSHSAEVYVGKLVNCQDDGTHGYRVIHDAITAGRTCTADDCDRSCFENERKPDAYITETEQGEMVWTKEMYGEACMYCDDGGFPEPLFRGRKS